MLTIDNCKDCGAEIDYDCVETRRFVSVWHYVCCPVCDKHGPYCSDAVEAIREWNGEEV